MKCYNVKPIYYTLLFMALLVLLQLLPNAKFAIADRQSELENKFDIVYTFDNLKNWRGKDSSGSAYDVNDMPKKLDGSPTHWGVYANYITNPPADWIGNHGPEYTWGGGKALCINYNRMPSKDGIAKGYGPSTIGMYIGDGTPDSGYKRVHIFFMLKHHAEFFNMDSPTVFHNTGVIKFLEIESGFRAINQWGTVEQQQKTCSSDQYRYGYGINFQIFNFTAFSRYSNIGLKEQMNTATTSASGCYVYEHAFSNRGWTQAGFGPEYKAGKWIGMEIMSDIGTAGNADGSTEMWVYDEKGKQIGYQKMDSYNKLKLFDHKYNKIMMGVNRIGYSYSDDASDSDENRMYIDDFIVHSSRIAPTYFYVLGSVLSVPTGPGAISISKE